jgi:membrane protease YdiL (CAAX protease family)
LSAKQKITLFVGIVFSITYPSWILAAILSHNNPDSAFVLPLHLLGGASPLIATLIYLVKTKSYHTYFLRFTHLKDIRFLAWLIVSIPILIALFAQLIITGHLNLDPEFQRMGIVYAIGLLFFGPIPEEMGWRGVLFDQLYSISFKKAQIYTAIIWFLWHIPLFFIVGTYQNALGIFSYEFLFFGIYILIQSFIMGYLYQVGMKNLILPILFHYFVNLFGEMFIRDLWIDLIMILGYVVVLMILMILEKRKPNLFTLSD